ncbi:hypothetical protein KKB10_02925 [Patescibacteria group bacterium]|nr:hypothetical protein [Patescibacteria group bacterium]MBU1075265.1 hypothetical protein [Patescibacteria group bacterium]MBU1952165.1 hypothetical protein [Patescibacteria group bacterium]MBU2236221.1 hypothetical protein [Patescibacteria group bacterium]
MKRTLWILGLAICTVAMFWVTGCDQTDSPMSPPTDEVVVDQPGEEGAQVEKSALSNYWRSAVYREICYALSRVRYNAGDWGASTRIYHGWFAGDWDYSNRSNIIGWGGECKQFAREIVWRATGQNCLPTSYYYANGDIAWCRPGDVIQRRPPNQHTAIVFKVLARDSHGRATKIDVIDSNYIRYHTIGRHVLSGSTLSKYKVW